MTEAAANPKVDAYLAKAKKWQDEFVDLRRIARACPLTEDLKWGQPCYTFDQHNVIILHGFKEYVAILFIKGALLKDPKGILIKQTENVQSARQIRFTDVRQITEMEATLEAYIHEAIELEKAGLKVEFKKPAEFAMPEEFESKLNEMPALKAAFQALTPGRQRAYLLHFSSAKQAKTREARIDKCVPQILDGKGLDD